MTKDKFVHVSITLITGEVVRLSEQQMEKSEIFEHLKALSAAVDAGRSIAGTTTGGDLVNIPSRSVLYVRVDHR